MSEFWDQRYSRSEYVYGKSPNHFFAEQVQQLQPGVLLMPAEGEGRNAVFAASKGWEVHAFDISREGRLKAERLAQSNEVTIHYQISSLEEVEFEDGKFDLIALIFAHFSSKVKIAHFKKLSRFLRPGGMVILEGFSKNQLLYSSKNPKAGGPKDMDLLYSEAEIEIIFPEFEIMQLYEQEVQLNEGDFHVGKSSVVRFVGRKKV